MKFQRFLIRRREHNNAITLFLRQLRVGGAEGEAAAGERGWVGPRGVYEVRGDLPEVRGGREVADADDGEHLARGLEVLPRRGYAAAEHELEAEAARVPGLVREGALLVLRVVGPQRGEVHARVLRDQRRVVPQALRRDRPAHRQHRHADGGTGLDAQPGLHGGTRRGRDENGRSDGGRGWISQIGRAHV